MVQKKNRVLSRIIEAERRAIHSKEWAAMIQKSYAE